MCWRIKEHLFVARVCCDDIGKFAGRNSVAFEFAQWLVHKCLLQDRIVTQFDLMHTLEELTKITPAKDNETLARILENIKQFNLEFTAKRRNDAAVDSLQSSKFLSSVELQQTLPAVPPTLEQNYRALFDDWLLLYQQQHEQIPPRADKIFAGFVQNLMQQNILGTEKESAFYRFCFETAIEKCFTERSSTNDSNVMAVASSSSSLEHPNVRLAFKAVDAFARLVVVLVKHAVDKITLFQRVLIVASQILHRDYTQKQSFNQKPYHRFFAELLRGLATLEPSFEPFLLPLLFQFAEVFHQFQPTQYAGFAFAWLDLISQRSFMPKILKDPKGWPIMQQLLVELFQFLEPYLRNAKLTPPIRLLYKGTLRILLVLLHDFPEFLCDYHLSLCDVIPTTCLQLRNLILSAFPRTMKLPDPFTPNLKVDLLAEIKDPPHILSNYLQALVESNIKVDLDLFLKTCEPISFLNELIPKLQLTSQEMVTAKGTKYNVPLINSLVIYVGNHAIIEFEGVQGFATLSGASMEIFRYLTQNLDMEGRYLLFNAIANQLRYPNNHTHYFSRLILYLFAEAPQEIVQEQITRVLVERLIVHRPHPWGLLITFIELIKNPIYHFWTRSFIRCAPEIERLFDHVGSSLATHSKKEPPPPS